MREAIHFRLKVHLLQDPDSGMAASWIPGKTEHKASAPSTFLQTSSTSLFAALEYSQAYCRYIFYIPLLAWWFPHIWDQTSHVVSATCQPSTSDSSSSFNASSDLFKVEGLSSLHKLLRPVISALSMFDRLVLKQTLQTAKCHSERNWKHFF